jgi:hypothetical protein
MLATAVRGRRPDANVFIFTAAATVFAGRTTLHFAKQIVLFQDAARKITLG